MQGVLQPIEPAGWRWGEHHTAYLDSDNVKFIYAAWSSDRIDPNDEHRVLCIYGNPDYDGKHGIILETIATVDRSLIESHKGWKGFGGTYLRCENDNVNGCEFG